jgi:hypothetical protein
LSYQSKRQKNELLRAQLDLERSSFISHWKSCADFILPRRQRMEITDVNRGDRRNSNIIDNTATLAVRTLRAGMMSGVTSPARPWFRLATNDQSLSELGDVKSWLYLVERRMESLFVKSNLYNALPVVYGDMGYCGTAAMLAEEDLEQGLRFYPFPVGSYMIGNDHRLKVNTFVRDFRMSVRQLVEKFGERNKRTGTVDWTPFSSTVENLYKNNHLEAWIDVTHIIQPNEEYDPSMMSAKYKKYSSCYYERGSMGAGQNTYLKSEDEDKFLRESGYDYFPVLCPRWEITGEDVYGTTCPGMDSLGDIKALQLMQKRKAQAIEKMVNPPMVAPSQLRNQKTSILPGDITYSDEREGSKGFRPAHEVNFRVAEIMQDIADHQNRIRRSFFEDLFLMLAQSDRRQITAREIEERHEEKLLALGPVLEQLNQDLLDPLIDIAFDVMMKQGRIPEPPEALQGQDLKIEYISIMAQAQKLIGLSGVERFTSFVGNVLGATQDQAVLDKIDVDQLIDVYGDLTSIPPGIIRPDENVAQMRESRAKQMQMQQQAQMIQQSAATARDLASADTSGDNALTKLLAQAKAGQLVPIQ